MQVDICITCEQILKHCWVDKYNHGLRVFVPANPWHYQLNYFNITDILKLLQFGTYRNRHLDFAKFHMSSEHYVMLVWQWPRRETCRDDRRHVAGDGDMENMEMLEQVLSLWVWGLLLPSVGQFWHRLNHIRRGPLLGPFIRWKHLPALFHLRIS